MKSGKQKYDIVIPWVDGGDPEWLKEKNHYACLEGKATTTDNSETRFRDWDTIRYFFRSIEKNMPWVNKVHFITWGHLPEWMNPECKKLNIVNHRDYIPEKYLPTFSSHTIELNIHRIKGLSQQFIYFNDDIVVLQKTKEEDFFRNGLPCDFGILTPLLSSHRFSVQDTGLTDIEIINDHFKKKDVIGRNPFKWFNLCYGAHVFKTMTMMPYPIFSNFYGRHVCNSFDKRTFEEVWEKEAVILDSTSMHKFRTRRDVNQWLIRDWQLASGKFAPISPERGRYYALKNDNSKIIRDIVNRRCKVICINDNGVEEIVDFEKSKREIIQALDTVFPDKSSFEL